MLKKESGIIMIEVLVAIAILAIGLLGLMSLQLYSLKAAHSSSLRSNATDLARDLSERVRSLRPPKLGMQDSPTKASTDENGNPIKLAPDYGKLNCSWDTDKYTCNIASGFSVPSDQGSGTQTLAQKDLANWLLLVRNTLPLGTGGGGVICKDNTLNDGTAAINNPGDTDFVTTTGCLTPSDDATSAYQKAPYVIKIWWQDERPTKDNPTPKLTRFTTSF